MGQYYRPLLIFKDGTKRSALSHRFNKRAEAHGAFLDWKPIRERCDV